MTVRSLRPRPLARAPKGPRRWLAVGALALAMWLGLSRGAPCGIVETWEFSPYRIHVWLAVEATPDLPENTRKEIIRVLLDQTEMVFGGTWDLHVAAPPEPFVTEATYRLEQLPVADLVERAKLGKLAAPKKKPPDGTDAAAPSPAETAGGGDAAPAAAEAAPGSTAAPSAAATQEKAAPERDLVTLQLRDVFAGEKLIVVSVTSRPDHWWVQARELDCRSRQWGPLIEIPVGDPALLAPEAAAAAHAAFLPVARTESVQENKTAVMRMRAGGLARDENCPVLVGPDAVLQPYIRYNDRYGEPKPGGVQTLPWTSLVVTQREGTGVTCDIHSGGRVALGGRSSARTERFALAVRPSYPTTRLQMRTLDKVPQPLSGYDVYAKDPHSEETKLLGRTDWRGTMEIPPVADYPLRLVYVKNGGSLLARLPIVPGAQRSLQVDLQSDDKRLQAEGFLLGVQGALTDLVAQRELIIKRLRNRILESKMDEADKLLAEFKTLPTRDELQKLIDQNQPRITSPHPKVQAKIDKQFEDTRKLLFKFIDPAMIGRLEAEVAAGKAVPPTVPPPPPPAAPAAAPTPTPAPASAPTSAPTPTPAAATPPAQ